MTGCISVRAASASADARDVIAAAIGVATTGAMKRYPRLGTVSMNLGLSESSSMAARNLFRITFRLPSKSTWVPSGQRVSFISFRVTISPRRLSSMTRTRKD